MKPIIGIVAHLNNECKSPLGQSHLGNTYVVSINKAGGIPVIIPTTINEDDMERYITLCDGFLFSGGIDISPAFYGEDSHIKLGATSQALDKVQIPLMKKVIAAKKPVLGICRGHQVLNVASGGTLYQDLSEKEGVYVKHFQDTDPGDISHQVFLESESILSTVFEKTIYTNSYHHQAVKTTGPNVKIIAHSKDDIVEAIQLEDYPFGLGIQWHPEAMFAHGDESMRPIFELLVSASAENQKNKTCQKGI